MLYRPNFKFALRDDLKNEKKFLPSRKETYSIGWDVLAAPLDRQDIVIKPGEYFKIPLGFRCLPEEGWWYELHPRSSSFMERKMHNLVGIIDKYYDVEVVMAGQYVPSSTDLKMHDLVIRFGESIGQIIPIRRIEMKVEEISNQEFEAIHQKFQIVSSLHSENL
jgi:dUTPase